MQRALAAIVLVTPLLACGLTTDPTGSGEPNPSGDSIPYPNLSAQFRVANVGSESIDGLVVQFPGQRVDFGNVSAGTTTSYRTVVGGAYRYAAYQFRLNGSVQHQPVTDWVGERPMDGQSFTYAIELTTGSSPSSRVVRLVESRRDK